MNNDNNLPESFHPLFAPALIEGVRDGFRGLLPLIDSLPDEVGFPEGTQPSHLGRLAREALDRDDLPADKIRGWLGFVQGVLIARGQLLMNDERDRTRPIFHEAYRAVGISKPRTVDVSKN